MFSKPFYMQYFLILVFLVSANSASALNIGDNAPNIIGRTIKHKLFRLSRLDNNKPTLINFFATNCAPCKKEIPELAKLEKIYPNINFVVVTPIKEEMQKVTKFIKSLSASPQIIVIGNEILKQEYEIYSVPYTIILKPDRTVRNILKGYIEPKKLKEILSGL